MSVTARNSLLTRYAALCLAGLIALCSVAAAAPKSSRARAAGTAREPDWKTATPEYKRVLGDLIALDTSNPPGNEIQVAGYLKAMLEKEGIACEVFEPAPGRANLVARLKGAGTERPLLLLGHMDVVGVDRPRWTTEPFVMTERDSFYYGRGVIDDKGMVAAEAMTLLWLKRLKVPLTRDVILLAECDEESGGGNGVEWMLEHHKDAIDAAYAINEGGRTTIVDGRIQYVGLQCAEKRSINYTITATGSSGHAAMPRADNAIVHLARAIDHVSDPPYPVWPVQEVKDFFASIAPMQPPALRAAMEKILYPDSMEAGGAVLASDLMYNAMLRHTVSPTIVKGGFRTNVIPSSAEATVNVRLLPGMDPKAFGDDLQRRISDPEVKVTFTPPAEAESPSVPFHGPVVDALKRATARVLPGTIVVPLLSTGATDSAALRRAGIQAYGLLPFPLTTDDAARMHGDSERMPVTSLAQGLRLLYGVTAGIAGY